jgi:hypothetical protein
VTSAKIRKYIDKLCFKMGFSLSELKKKWQRGVGVDNNRGKVAL